MSISHLTVTLASLVAGPLAAQGPYPLPLTPRPVVSDYGSGCANAAGTAPTLAGAVQNPFDATNYTLHLTMQDSAAHAGYASLMAIGLSPTEVPLLGCQLLSSSETTVGGVLDAQGRMSLPIPVPHSVLFLGYNTFCQGAVFDPSGTQGITTTQGVFTHQAPWDPAETSRVRPSLSGVVISELVTLPNPTVGLVKGQFVELYNRNAPHNSLPIDLSGYTLSSQSGSTYTIPQGTSLAGDAFLILDMSNGVVTTKTAPNTTILQTGFNNDFFPSTLSPGALALKNNFGGFTDAVVWGWPATTGLTQAITNAGEWTGPGVSMTFFPGYGDIGFARKNLAVVDTNDVAVWTEGNNVGPTPGLVYNPEGNEATLAGYVTDTAGGVVPNATVQIPGASISTTTNALGYFSIANAPSGAVDFAVTAAGYAPTWHTVDHKSRFRNQATNITMTKVVAANTTSNTVGPAGGTIVDPAGRFELTIPAGFLTQNTNISATWIPEGKQPDVADSVSRVTFFGQRYLMQNGGSLFVQPHIAAPANSGLEVGVKLKFADPFRPIQGEAIELDLISDSGVVEHPAPGHLSQENGSWYANFNVPHFSTVSGYKYVKSPSGKRYLMSAGESTMDTDGDGDADIFDSLIQCWNLCPGNTGGVTTTVSASVTVAQGSGWNVNGEASAESGALTKLIAKGSIKVGGGYHQDSSQSGTSSVSMQVTAATTYTGKDNDKERKCLFVSYTVISVWTEFCPCHRRPYSKNGDLIPPQLILLVPTGTDWTKEVIGHCP